jgi:hypothetical protein
LSSPNVASVELSLMFQQEAVRQMQRWFFEDTAHYFHSHITKEVIVSSLVPFDFCYTDTLCNISIRTFT